MTRVREALLQDEPADDEPDVRYEVEDHVATITLNRPHRRNAISVRMLELLSVHFAEADADQDVRERLARGNAEYEARFGHVFLISAAGRDASEILAALTERLGNDPDTELRVAAEEHRRITRLRIEQLLAP